MTLFIDKGFSGISSVSQQRKVFKVPLVPICMNTEHSKIIEVKLNVGKSF
jgi:hypothetical protein